MSGRLLYRTRQFWHYLAASPASHDLETVKDILQPSLYALFSSLAPEEQAHSIKILNRFLEMGEKHTDLLMAALLHDVGKSRFPLRLWERVFIVIGKHLFPQLSKDWGMNNPLTPQPGLWNRFSWAMKKPFMVSELHPQWGAEMVAAAGGSSLLAALVRRHQQKLVEPPTAEEDVLLAKLLMVDDES
jgi:hypothetical protein